MMSKQHELLNGLERLAKDNTLQVTVDLQIPPQLKNYLKMHLDVMHFSSLKVYLKDRSFFSGTTAEVKYGLPTEADLFSNELNIIEYHENLYLQAVRPIHKDSELIGYVSGAICLTSDKFINYMRSVISSDFILWLMATMSR